MSSSSLCSPPNTCANWLALPLGLLSGMCYRSSWRFLLTGVQSQWTRRHAIAFADRYTRYPPLFQDAPTDAEYAMELISQRVARGLDVKPKARRTRSSTPSHESDRFSLRTISGDPASLQPIDPLASSGSGTWQKWVDRVDTSMNVAKDAKKLFKDGQVSTCCLLAVYHSINALATS